MPGLDVMRGLAISMVLLYHGTAEHDAAFQSVGNRFALWLRDLLVMGKWGVHLFFILSGFLITGILLDSRSKADYFRNFYLRRVLRIVPAYLAMLLVLVLTRSISVRYLVTCLFYFCNMTAVFGAHPEYGPFWSLSVEEQFYLIWPFIVRKLSMRNLALLSAGLLVFTPVLRLALLYGPNSLRDIHYKTWDVMDFFAAGSCIAMAVRSSRLRPHLSRAVAPLLMSGALILGLQLLIPAPSRPLLQNIGQATLSEPWLLAFSGLIVLAYLRPGIAAVAAARPLVSLANISYGLYLCHVFFFDLIGRHWPERSTAALSPAMKALVQFAVELAVSITVAYISRYTLEQYFLRRKPHHPRTSSRHSTATEIA